MSEAGKIAASTVLTRGDASPEAMEKMLYEVLFFGKSSDSDNSSSTTTSEEAPINSKQLQGDPFDRYAAGEFVPPRYNPQIWAAAMEQNTRLGRCIRTFARNTVGLGWHIEPTFKIADDSPKELKEVVQNETAILTQFFEHPNGMMPTSQMFYLEKVDEEATGSGYVEVVRDLGNRIAKMYHAPSVTMRVRLDGDKVGGFIQIRGNEKRYFKEFGDTNKMSAKTGKYDDNTAFEDLASEVLHFKVYSPTSVYYGAPRYVSAAPAVSGNRLAALRNVSFFENDAVPRMAILVSGGRLDPLSVQAIEDFFKSKQRGAEKAHQVMVIQTEAQKVGFQQNQPQAKIDLQPLTVGVTEDASFQTYREANDEEIREVFGLARVFFTSDDVNRSTAQVSRELTNEQELEPDRLEKEYLINQKLVPELLGTRDVHVRFRFERMKLTDPMDTAQMDQVYASLGALTPNELRTSLGKPPFPKEFTFADKPLQVAMVEMQMQLAEAILGEWDAQIAQQAKMQQVQQSLQLQAQEQAQQLQAPQNGGEGGPPEEGSTAETSSGNDSSDSSDSKSSESTETETDTATKAESGSLLVQKGGRDPARVLQALTLAHELMSDAREYSAKKDKLVRREEVAAR